MDVRNERQARQRVIEIVRRTKVELGLETSPSYAQDRDRITGHFGIVVKEEPGHPFDEGEYIPANPPRIVIDPSDVDPDRLNFTFFHEVMHHLIRQDSHLYGFLHEHTPQNDQFKAAIDSYCNIGAAEFLIPSDEVQKAIAEHGFRITLIEDFDNRYPASKPAIAIQLAQCANHECFVVVCNYGELPRQTRGQKQLKGMPTTREPQLYIQYTASSPTNKYSISRFMPIPREHLLFHAYETQSLICDKDAIPFRSGTTWRAQCEAFFYKGKVYAVFNATDPQSPQQMELF